MKIAFYSGNNSKKHAARIIELLECHVPTHQYNHYAEAGDADLWHCVAPSGSINFIPRVGRSVLSLFDLRFIVSPETLPLTERILRLPLYRYHCRNAARLIAQNSTAKRRMVEQLGVAPDRVEVCPSLMAVHRDFEQGVPSREELNEVRAKLELAQSYILVVGDIDTMHGHTTILHALFEEPEHELNLVIYGRRTTHSDVLLKVVRDFGVAERVQFIYECSESDLRALYRMALVVIYFPTYESSTRPILEALFQRVPLILSDTELNREAAGKAAIYVTPYDVQSLEDAIREVIYNESYRGQLIAQCWAESHRYSSEGVAEELIKIYESL